MSVRGSERRLLTSRGSRRQGFTLAPPAMQPLSLTALDVFKTNTTNSTSTVSIRRLESTFTFASCATV